MSGPDAVITGLGAVTGAGAGATALRRALSGTTPRSGAIDRSAGYHLRRGAATGAVVRDFDPRPWIPAAALRRMSPASRMAVAAARMALEDAGLPEGDGEEAPLGVWLSTSYGPATFTERILEQILREGPQAASPFLFNESVANAPAAQVALTLGAHGPNVTITQREAGLLIALGEAAEAVAAGDTTTVLAGGVDELTPLLHALLDRFRALARSRDEAGEVARPFDRRRDGVLAGEGAVIAVIEERSRALGRGAPVRVRLRPLGSAFDPTSPAVGWGCGAAHLARALRRALERAGLEPGDIDAVVSCASGSRGGDRLEALTLRRAWEGRPLPPVLAPRAVLGDHAGAQLAAAILAFEGLDFAPTPGFEEVDPELGVIPHQGGPLPGVSRLLITALAQGGAAAWAVVERQR